MRVCFGAGVCPRRFADATGPPVWQQVETGTQRASGQADPGFSHRRPYWCARCCSPPCAGVAAAGTSPLRWSSADMVRNGATPAAPAANGLPAMRRGPPTRRDASGMEWQAPDTETVPFCRVALQA